MILVYLANNGVAVSWPAKAARPNFIQPGSELFRQTLKTAILGDSA